jgi:hypothetical protein
MTNPYQDYKLPATSGNLLKLEDGKPVKIRIVGEPVVFDSEYKDQMTTRYAWVVWNYREQLAQIFMVPKTAFKQVYELATNEEWGDPTQYDIAFKRSGTGKDTVWVVQPSPIRSPLAVEALNKTKEVDLKDVLSKFPSISNIYFLSEAVKKPASAQAEVSIEDFGGSTDGVDLSEIPF